MVDMVRKRLQISIANSILELKGKVKAYNQIFYKGEDEHNSVKLIEKLLDIWR